MVAPPRFIVEGMIDEPVAELEHAGHRLIARRDDLLRRWYESAASAAGSAQLDEERPRAVGPVAPVAGGAAGADLKPIERGRRDDGDHRFLARHVVGQRQREG